MTIGSVLFLIGAGLQAGAVHLGMLRLGAGRIMLGKSPAHCKIMYGSKKQRSIALVCCAYLEASDLWGLDLQAKN